MSFKSPVTYIRIQKVMAVDIFNSLYENSFDTLLSILSFLRVRYKALANDYLTTLLRVSVLLYVWLSNHKVRCAVVFCSYYFLCLVIAPQGTFMIVVIFRNYGSLVYANTRSIYHFIIHNAFFQINIKALLKLQITKPK